MFTKFFRILATAFLSLSIFLISSSTALAVPAFVDDIPLPGYGDGIQFDGYPWYTRAVYYLYFAHVADEAECCNDGTTLYGPNRAITRGQFVTFLGRLASECGKEIEQESKWDLSEKDCIAWAVKNHILYGKGNGSAKNDTLTRQEMAVFLIRFASYMQTEIKDTNAENTYTKFADLSFVSNWAKESMKKAYCLKLIAGEKTSDNAYFLHPQRTATRAEAAQAVYHYVQAAGISLPYYIYDLLPPITTPDDT